MLNHCILNRLPSLASHCSCLSQTWPCLHTQLLKQHCLNLQSNYSRPLIRAKKAVCPLLEHTHTLIVRERFCGFKCGQAHYRAVRSQPQTFLNLSLLCDPLPAFNNCRHSFALFCDHAWMKSVKQLPELLGCLRLTFPQSKIYDLRAHICHGNGSNLLP